MPHIASFVPLVAALCLLLYSVLVPAQVPFLVGLGAYPFMLTMVLAIGFALHRALPAPRALFAEARKRWVGLATSAVLVLLVFHTVTPELRVFSDEALIAGVSKSLFYEKSGFYAAEGKWYYDGFFPTLRELDKRPYLFPFLGQLVHLAAGYRPENLIALNGAFLFGLLFTAWAVVAAALGPVAGVAAQLLVLSHPVVPIVATGAGLELFACLMLAWSLLALRRHLESPTAESLLLVWAACLALLHSRYESALFVAIIAGALFALKKVRREHVERYALAYACTPLFVLPVVWQRWIRPGVIEQPDTVPFAFSHFVTHLAGYVKSQFTFSSELPYANLTVCLGTVAGVLALYEIFAKKRRLSSDGRHATLLVFAGCAAAYFVLVLSFYFSDYAHPAAARLYLIPCVVSALLPFLLLSLRPSAALEWPALVASLALFAGYHPIATLPLTTHSLHKTREVAFVRQFLEKLGTRNVLLVAEDSEVYTMRDYGAVGFGTLNRAYDELALQKAHHLFQDVYVVQHVRYEDEKPAERLRPGFQVQPQAELENSELHYVRISKVVRFPTREDAPPQRILGSESEATKPAVTPRPQ